MNGKIKVQQLPANKMLHLFNFFNSEDCGVFLSVYRQTAVFRVLVYYISILFTNCFWNTVFLGIPCGDLDAVRWSLL